MYDSVTAESGQKPDSDLGLELSAVEKHLRQKNPQTSLKLLIQAKL